MKKIKVQSRISLFLFFIIVIFSVVLTGVVIYFMFLDNSYTASANTRAHGGELIGGLIVFLPLLFREVMKKGQYVSELIVADSFISLVYKEKGKITTIKTIESREIDYFKVDANISSHYTGRRSYVTVNYFVDIKLRSAQNISFFVNPSSTELTFCAYHFLLDLMKVSSLIPNFKYKVNSSDETIKEDIQHFALYGKRLPLHKKRGGKFLIVVFVISISCFLFLLFSSFSLFLTSNSMNSSYIQTFSYIDKLRNNGNYNEALAQIKYLKILEPNDYNIYLYEAYIYERQRLYEKEIVTANKALSMIESGVRSKYDDSFGKNSLISKYIFKSGNDKYARVYDRLASANFYLKRYKEAEIFYSKELEYITYKFPNIYFYRGVCRFYSGNKQGAIEDFFKQKEIYDNYFSETEGGYQYDKKDYDLVNRWIEACKY